MKKKFLAMLMCLCMALALTPTGVSAYDGTKWQSDDQIGISMLKAGTDTVSKDAKNRMYSYSDNNGFTPSDSHQGISYPLDGSDVDFHAYYPYNDYVGNGETFSFSLRSSQSTQSAIDLMYASTDSTEEVKYNKNNTKVDLNFTPQLAKIQVNLTCDESDISLDGAAIKITNQISTGNFNILNGQLTRGSDSSTDISLNTTRSNYDRAEAGGLLLPTNADNPIISGRKIIVKLAWGTEAEYDIPDNQKFIAGNTTTINLQLSATINEGTSEPEEAHLTLLNDISSVKREGISTTLDSSGNIAPGEITRTSNSNATVKFTVTGMRKYSYTVVNSGADEPFGYADTYACVDYENTITLTFTNLSAGAQDIYIEGSGKFGINRKIKMTIPAYIPDTYSITYDANGGTSTMADGTATEDVPFTLPVCGFTAPSGKQFKSWAIGSTTGTTVNPSSKYTFTEATTVYAIWEDIPTYTIASDKAYKEFKANLGYSDITPETFTITNTGNQTVTLSKNSSSIFDISDFSKTTLAPNDTATFTVKPILGLKKGVSIDALDISTGNETHVYINLDFVVNDALSVKIDPASTTITNGDSKTLTANPTGGNGNYTYKWYKGNEATEFATTKEVTVSPNTTTTYKVVVNDTIEDKNTTSTITVNLKKYEITYDANGGTNTMTADIATEGEEFTLPACGFKAPLGKQFKSWAIGSADSKITVDAGEKYTFTTDKTVYPVWQAIQYKLIEGKDQTVIAGESKDLTFKIDAPLELLDKVYINDKELDENNYTTASGSTIITLNKDYVSTLTAGDYILKTTYTNGTSVETTFTVKAKETTSTDPMKPVDTNNTPNKNNVSTGDNSHITLWTSLLSISGLIGLVYVVLRKKRRVD